ncbi:MAG: hypothetical protein GF332_01755 [Candidatus Moranbacteria bacterium]|nr:hypothetical protein [Candidatus Moranbacteria bacterium]
MLKKIQKTKLSKIFLATLVSILLIGIALRIYRHSDFLHFELDQARDAIVISSAYEQGPGQLPLLGPRAAGTMLRLGPFFYYTGYLSALLFGNHPAGMNGINLILSVAAILLVYCLLRYYFSRFISLATTSIFSASIFIVVYARFAWNPNMLIFFIPLLLLNILAILKQTYKNKKTQPWLFYSLSFLTAVCMQLHFLAFLAVPFFLLMFAIIYFYLLPVLFKLKNFQIKSISIAFKQVFKQNIKGLGRLIKKAWRQIALALLIFMLMFAPLFLNEYLTGADNTKEFFKAISEKSEKSQDHDLLEKLVRNYQEYSRGYFLIITGLQKTDNISFDFWEKKTGIIDFSCDRKCRQRLNGSIGAFLFMTLGFSLFLYNIFKSFQKVKKIVNRKSNRKYKYEQRKAILQFHFLILIFLLFLAAFLGFLPVAYKFPPRFLLFTQIVAFVLLGLILKFISRTILSQARKFKKYSTNQFKLISKICIIMLTAFLFGLNIFYNLERFQEQASAHTTNPIEFERDTILKEDIRFTRIQQTKIIDWIRNNSDHHIVYVWGPPKYYRAFVYELIYRENFDGRRLRYSAECGNADYFAVVGADSDDDFFPKARKIFSSVANESFGTLKVHKLNINNPDLIEKKNCGPEKEKKPNSYARRYTWAEAWKKLWRDSTD